MKGTCLIDQGVFDLSVIREYYDVAREARQKNEEVHVARAHVIIVEKLPTFRKNHAENTKVVGWCLETRLRTRRRTRHCFKIWGILQMDFSGCLDGWAVQMADAAPAYIQATLRGTP